MRLGSPSGRAVLEVLAEVGAECSIMTTIDQMLDRHLTVSDAALEAAGGDRLPPVPIHAVNDNDLPPSPEVG